MDKNDHMTTELTKLNISTYLTFILCEVGLKAIKNVFGGLRTTQMQTSMRIRDYALIGKYHIKTCYKRNCTILASLCS